MAFLSRLYWSAGYASGIVTKAKPTTVKMVASSSMAVSRAYYTFDDTPCFYFRHT